jgi:hypothetical protein
MDCLILGQVFCIGGQFGGICEDAVHRLLVLAIQFDCASEAGDFHEQFIDVTIKICIEMSHNINFLDVFARLASATESRFNPVALMASP